MHPARSCGFRGLGFVSKIITATVVNSCLHTVLEQMERSQSKNQITKTQLRFLPLQLCFHCFLYSHEPQSQSKTKLKEQSFIKYFSHQNHLKLQVSHFFQCEAFDQSCLVPFS